MWKSLDKQQILGNFFPSMTTCCHYPQQFETQILGSSKNLDSEGSFLLAEAKCGWFILLPSSWDMQRSQLLFHPSEVDLKPSEWSLKRICIWYPCKTSIQTQMVLNKYHNLYELVVGVFLCFIECFICHMNSLQLLFGTGYNRNNCVQ